MNLTEAHKIHVKRRFGKRVCRGLGSGKGKTGGRGGKGQSARSGWHSKYYFEGGQMPLVRKLPKRGFSNFTFRKVYATINLRDLDGHDLAKAFDPERMLKEGLINSFQDGVKVLGEGELKGAVTIRAHRFSASAMAKITKAGGKYEWIEAQPKPEKKFKKPEGPKHEKPKKAEVKEKKKKEKVEPGAPGGKPAGGPPKEKKPEGQKPAGGKPAGEKKE